MGNLTVQQKAGYKAQATKDRQRIMASMPPGQRRAAFLAHVTIRLKRQLA